MCPDRYIAVGATYQKLKHTLEARIMSVAQDAPQYLQAIQVRNSRETIDIYIHVLGGRGRGNFVLSNLKWDSYYY